ncbi:MAG: sigma-70 family RNA polymerase sigma factor, partial [Gemmatimonadota bacterium]
FRTTRHRAIDCLRRQRRDNELFSEASDADVIAEVDGAESARLDPEAVKELLDALPPLLREAVTLRYLNDLTYGEIALVMGCPVGTVRSRLFHARQRLEQLLVSRRGLRESNERTADTSKQGDER